MPRVKLGALSFYYEIHGKGEPLLLIPGVNADHASWDSVYRQLARHFRAY